MILGKFFESYCVTCVSVCKIHWKSNPQMTYGRKLMHVQPQYIRIRRMLRDAWVFYHFMRRPKLQWKYFYYGYCDFLIAVLFMCMCR